MSINVGDIKRAILGGGDVSTFTGAWHQALGSPPVPSFASLEAPVALPAATALLKYGDDGLGPLVTAWAGRQAYPPASSAGVDVILAGLAPYGRYIAGYLEHVFDEVRPDIIAIDTPPLELSANLLYAFSLPCAVGLPYYGNVLAREGGQLYANETFYPGNINEIAIIRSWFKRTALLSVGVPQLKPKYAGTDFEIGYLDGSHVGREMSRANILAAYRALDESLSGVSRFEEGVAITGDVCRALMGAIGSQMRETLVEEACYIASRIWEIAGYAGARGEAARFLAMVDITHYQDVAYVLGLLKQGIRDETYTPPRGYSLDTAAIMTGNSSARLNEQAAEHAPESTPLQGLFQVELDRLMENMESEILAESAADRLIPEIVTRTRLHPDIARGASVRGTIACKEILQSLAVMNNGLTRPNIRKAALITLPPRMAVRQGSDEITIVTDIINEVLYDVRFSRVVAAVPPITSGWLSPGDILDSLQSLKPLTREQSPELAQKGAPTVITDAVKNQEMLKYLESQKFLKRERTNQYSLTPKAIEYLLEALEKQLKAGEITPGEYHREKDRLMAMLDGAAQPRLKMSAKELANTIMELMDAQDRQWSAAMSFERMHIYYHIKANSRREELGPYKQDYYGLKTLIDDLERQGILMATETANGYTLTGEALDTLLEYLTVRVPGGQGLPDAMDFGRMLFNERKHEIRRFSSGDFFRDISVRHTLKEIARQKKDLSRVRRSDFRVFMKQRRKLQSDIVLCLDTSASMGPQYKLMYARLVATGLVKAAIENGDRVGVVTFNNYGQTTIPLTDKDKDAIINHIVKISARGNTNIGDGLKCAHQLLFQARSHNQKYILLITDGEPTAVSERDFNRLKAAGEKDLTEESAMLETRKAAAKGVKVSVIHIAGRDEPSGKFIKAIAQNGRGKVRRISSPEDLETVLR